jgi:hypothetical protein
VFPRRSWGGKTTLVGYAISAVAGFDVSTVIGAESETGFAFAAVHQLLIPFLASIGELPVRRRQALTTAFGLEPGPPPDRFLSGWSAWPCCRAAEARPVLSAIDGAHWIDAESALLLALVARGLYADRVGMCLGLTGDSVNRQRLRNSPPSELADCRMRRQTFCSRWHGRGWTRS